MPRRELILCGVVLLVAQLAQAEDPHLDLQLVPGGCASCHQGHGEPGSPMLGSPQKDVCLACHDSRARADAEVRRGHLAAGARPVFMAPVLNQAYQHPVSEEAFSRFDPGTVVCSSCHSPHRRSVELPGAAANPRKRSTRNPRRFEHELCATCHGGEGPRSQSPDNVARLFDPTSRSSHPVLEPSTEASPSVLPALSGQVVNCTDCHGNANSAGPRGPHGSSVRGLLRASYATSDGGRETPALYRLCYSCHDRDRVLDSELFPAHRLHVVEERIACATCHSSHGSLSNRALIRFGEGPSLGGVSPSPTTGRLAFESEVAGRGSCELSCHGVDHGPRSYGENLVSPLVAPRSSLSTGPPITTPRTRDRRRGVEVLSSKPSDPPPPD